MMKKICLIVVPNDQLSLAIGKERAEYKAGCKTHRLEINIKVSSLKKSNEAEERINEKTDDNAEIFQGRNC